jgi:hypothetical protein
VDGCDYVMATDWWGGRKRLMRGGMVVMPKLLPWGPLVTRGMAEHGHERFGKCGACSMAEHGRCMDTVVVVQSFSHPGLVRHNGV